VIRLVRKLGRRVLYGGFGGPKPYEAAILNATVAALPPRDARALTRQIALIERVQRWNEDRMVILGFEDKSLLPKLDNEETNHCLAKVRLKGAFGSLTATVMTHRGLLSSLEFPQSPRKTNGQDFSVEVAEVHAWDPGSAGAIDAEEHGTGT
jgi:hypothetical protein